jgi:hypothetical protein
MLQLWLIWFCVGRTSISVELTEVIFSEPLLWQSGVDQGKSGSPPAAAVFCTGAQI